jgi:RNA polymerase primary sigma factor
VSKRYATSVEHASTLAAYLREIAKLPRLTPDEERALGERIQRDRDEAALSRLVESNLRFVVSYSRRYRGTGVSILDLIHEGNLGLMEAARRFDPARNVKFITYAVWWVREAMTHVLSDQMRAFSFPPKLLPVFGRDRNDVSLSQPVSPDNPQPFADSLPGSHNAPVEDELIHRADMEGLRSALHELNGKEREIVRLRFGLEDDEPRTLQEIGDRLHLSRERVRQIETRAKEKLRRSTLLRSRAS